MFPITHSFLSPLSLSLSLFRFLLAIHSLLGLCDVKSDSDYRSSEESKRQTQIRGRDTGACEQRYSSITSHCHLGYQEGKQASKQAAIAEAITVSG